MNIQWFPGHMAKTMRLIKENLKLVDIVIELLDARIPISSKNPEIDAILLDKPRIVVLNKSDLADENVTKSWQEYYKEKNIPVLLFDSIHSKNTNFIFDAVKNVLKDKIEAQKDKGMVSRSIKIMVVGVPNVGKSSFINKLVGRAVTIAGDRPGVTKGNQWIRLRQGFELLDTPGVLWPKFDNEKIGLKLAFIGSVKDEIIDSETLASHLLSFLNENYSEKLKERYKLSLTENMSGFELLEMVAKKRGFLISGGELDTLRAANIVLDEFRATKIGKISLEKPTDFE